MLDASHADTFNALQSLVDEVRDKQRPLALWVGAGASAWAGYPLWAKLASDVHTDFVRHAPPGYDRARAAELLDTRRFPEFFQLCRDCDGPRYFKALSATFVARKPEPVFDRFASLVAAIAPDGILTTNVDGTLEKHLPAYSVVGNRDLARARSLLDAREKFFCTLHGTASALESLVFTSEDYAALQTPEYLELLKRLLSSISVVFLGYGLQDDYVIEILQRNVDLMCVLGDGPHFAIMPAGASVSLPSSVRIIQYISDTHRDHRSSLQVLDEIRCVRSSTSSVRSVPQTVHPLTGETGHMLSSIFSAGTHSTSQTLTLQSQGGPGREAIIGPGWTDEELGGVSTRSFHDIVIGLVCFDRIFIPSGSLRQLHQVVGPQSFRDLVEADAVRVVHWTDTEAVQYPDAGHVGNGDLGSLTPSAGEKEATLAACIRRQIQANPGREARAEELFTKLEKSATEFTSSEIRAVPSATRGLLLRPSVRKMLGLSGAMPVSSIPRWSLYPVLRLAQVVRIGETCRLLGLTSAKLDFGADVLGYPVFCATQGKRIADGAASYVVAGGFGSDLGAIVARDPGAIAHILRFRDTQEAVQLRAEVGENLQLDHGGEVVAAINSGLQRSISEETLAGARSTFLELRVLTKVDNSATPALWSDVTKGVDYLKRWRQQSERMLLEYCASHHINAYDRCPCGSGEKLRWCCQEAVSS